MPSFDWEGTCPVSKEELITSYITLATKSIVFLATNGSIPSGPTERVYLALFAISIASREVVCITAKGLVEG